MGKWFRHGEETAGLCPKSWFVREEKDVEKNDERLRYKVRSNLTAA